MQFEYLDKDKDGVLVVCTLGVVMRAFYRLLKSKPYLSLFISVALAFFGTFLSAAMNASNEAFIKS